MKNVLVMAVCLLTLFSACEEKEVDVVDVQVQVDSSQAKAISLFVESDVVPKFGKPGVTDFVFQVYDVSGTLALSVKFYERATGLVTYVPMLRVGNYWRLVKKMTNNGWFDWRYVYSITKGNIGSTAYTLCATYNTFNSTGVNSIRWPFGADGSSWANKVGSVNGVQQQWLEGPAGGGCGHNCSFHVGTTEYYAMDWNRRKLTNWSVNDDLGAILKSPLDGEILEFGSYNTSYGPSKFVSVKQSASNNKTYKFFFGHMNSYPSTLYVGMPVKAGYTILGTLGSTGASSPHAHCSLRDYISSSNQVSVPFQFDAQ